MDFSSHGCFQTMSHTDDHLQSACHSELVRARCLQVEQTRVAVARSVGDNMERMLRARWPGSKDSGSEQPVTQRWWRPGLCSGSWDERKWSWDAPRWGLRAETRSVIWSSLNSSTQSIITDNLFLNSVGSTLTPLRHVCSGLWRENWDCLNFLGNEWNLMLVSCWDVVVVVGGNMRSVSWCELFLIMGDFVKIVLRRSCSWWCLWRNN